MKKVKNVQTGAVKTKLKIPIDLQREFDAYAKKTGEPENHIVGCALRQFLASNVGGQIKAEIALPLLLAKWAKAYSDDLGCSVSDLVRHLLEIERFAQDKPFWLTHPKQIDRVWKGGVK